MLSGQWILVWIVRKNMDSHGYMPTAAPPFLENGTFDLRQYRMGSHVGASDIP